MTLTREEILAMEPGTEFNTIVAKELFKATIINKPSSLSDKIFYLLVDGDHFNPIEKGKNLGNAWWRLSEEQAWEACPRYSTDISAAWEVESELIQKNSGVQTRYVWSLKWVTGWEDKQPHFREDLKLIHATPEQRCKAALLAVLNL
ncbi:hypothetical protein CA600_12555 [Paenibacillus sp. VTT E-133280]|uniref:BC1872 family protein n=1 Tax=Paenibacillus sp. VTT E-133280 TaxID=1986222 RepID=UPI000BA09ECC|nr:hypothetical protein [Paenibacillus sp. VTT E-133280]OZQ66084.1 hypothetical protein CA600_12555 [Paenibacillus sp. VTT E-133280]